MRTVIFLGAIYMASAINTNMVSGDTVVTFMAIVLVFAVFMDIIEFVNNLKR